MLPYFSIKHFIMAAVATLIAALAYNLIPEKRSVIVPSAERKPILFYDGKHGGGASRAYWDGRHAAKAICEVNPSEVFPYCGFLFSLGDGDSKGLDFTGFDGVRLRFAYSGPAPRLRIFMRNFDPLFSTPGNVETAKFNNISVPVEDFSKPLYLRLSDFSVAEWWLEASGAPREFSQPEFSNVIKFGFDLPNPVPYGRHELQLDRLELVGRWLTRQQWYLGILVLWVVFAGSWLLKHRLNIGRWRQRDVGRLAEAMSPTGEISRTDPIEQLTGAISRESIGEFIRPLYDAEGYRCDALAMTLIDIDDFTKITKRYGYDTSNETLTAVSRIIINNSRETDIICHWSDDRFLVVAPAARGVGLAAFAEKIRGLVHQHRFHREGGTFTVSLSAGVAESTPAKTFEQTFMQASNALLQAKAAGKNRVHYLS